MSAQGEKPGRFEEGAPIEDAAAAAARERAALAAAIASETDASASGGGRVGGGAAGNGHGGGAGVGGGSGGGPTFDRLAAEKRVSETDYPQMTRQDGACIFSPEELEILKTDMGKLKAKSTKAKDREATCKRLGAVDVIDLQKRKDVLTDRAHAWRKRALEKAEEEFRAGRALQAAAGIDERKRAFRKLIAGAKPYHAWNKGAAILSSEKLLGEPGKLLAFDSGEIEFLTPLSDAAIDEHLDTLFECFGIATPSTMFCAALLSVVGMKAFAVWTAMQEAKEKRAAPKPAPAPSLN